MSLTSGPATAVRQEEVYRLSVDQYHRMIDRHILGEDDDCELLLGLLYRKHPATPAEELFTLTVAQFHDMVRFGIIAEDDPVELIEGLLITKMSKNAPHRIALARAIRVLSASLLPGFSIQSQDPITLADSEPEPDACVIAGLPEDYPNGHPGPADVSLVIEVADSSLKLDRGAKLTAHARAGIPVYWLVNLSARTVEVYESPAATDGTYVRVTSYGPDATLLRPELLRTGIAVKDVLP